MVFRCLCFIFIVLLSGCSLLGDKQWAAYQVTVIVSDAAGLPVINAMLESNEVKTQITGSNGSASLQFRAPGLHVVTITESRYAIKQIKVLIPRDDAKIFHASLRYK